VTSNAKASVGAGGCPPPAVGRRNANVGATFKVARAVTPLPRRGRGAGGEGVITVIKLGGSTLGRHDTSLGSLTPEYVRINGEYTT
jgi:hypothetical protein